MERRYKDGNFVVRYGKEDNISNLWKEIVEINDNELRKTYIDNLVNMLESNSANNGFFSGSDIVNCGGSRGFVIDDKNLYYIFFDMLKTVYDSNKDKGFSDGQFFNEAIKATVLAYGGAGSPNRDKRLELTEYTIDNGDIVYPSISKQRMQNTLLCTEKAAISHNLWLMMGAKSHYCWTATENLSADNVSEEYKDDAHCFTVVEYDGKTILYDLSMGNFGKLPSTWLDSIFAGKGMNVDNIKNPGVYVKADDTLNMDKA